VFSGRLLSGLGVGALVAAGLAMAPAIGAPGENAHSAKHAPASVYGIGSFTPAAADPRLAAVFARSGLDTSGFRFTPTDSRHSGSHAVTVAVRARSTRTALAAERASSFADSASTVSLTPIAYNLGVAVGWRRFALSGDISKVDLAGMPGSREAVDVGVSYTAHRFTGRVKAVADRPVANAPKLTEDAPAYSLDVGGSYRLTRNLDVTAGVRYKAERDRLAQLSDDRRDSQAVYVGTAFRF
jgi:hypothetical protein